MRPVRFVRDALTLATGGALAQALSFAVAPILARLYAPHDFGLFSIYAFTLGVFAAVVCWAYEAAVVLPKEDREARDIVVLSIVIACFMAVVLVVPGLAGGAIVRALHAPGLEPWLGWISINLLALGVYQTLSYWYNRKADFRRLAVSRVVQSGVTAGGQVAGALVTAGPGGLIVGQVLGQVAASGYLWRRAVREGGLDAQERLRADTLGRVLKRYRRFPLYTSWGTLVGTSAMQVVPVLLAMRFGPVEAGLYFFGYRLVSSGVQLGTGSISQVLYHRAAAALNAGESIAPLVEMVVARLATGSVVVLGAFAAFAPAIFAVVFGAHWTPSGEYMRIVTPMFFVQMIASPVSIILFLLEKQQVAAIMQLALLGGSVGAIALGQALGAAPGGTLALYAATQTVLYLVYLAIVLRLAAASPSGLVRAFAAGRWLRPWSVKA
jgi:O-antigen/teichoic acid export membrane protein